MKLGWDRWRTRSWELVWSSASYHHHGLQREREREKTFKEEDHGQKGCWWSMVGCKDYYKVEYHHRLPIFITWSGGWLMGSQTERTDPCGWVGSLDGGGYLVPWTGNHHVASNGDGDGQKIVLTHLSKHRLPSIHDFAIQSRLTFTPIGHRTPRILSLSSLPTTHTQPPLAHPSPTRSTTRVPVPRTSARTKTGQCHLLYHKY